MSGSAPHSSVSRSKWWKMTMALMKPFGSSWSMKHWLSLLLQAPSRPARVSGVSSFCQKCCGLPKRGWDKAKKFLQRIRKIKKPFRIAPNNTKAVNSLCMLLLELNTHTKIPPIQEIQRWNWRGKQVSHYLLINVFQKKYFALRHH